MADVLKVDATVSGIDAYAEKSVAWANDLFIEFEVYWPAASQSAWITDGFFPYFYHERQNAAFSGSDRGSDVYLDFSSYPTFEWRGDGSTVTASHVASDTWHTVCIEIKDGTFINSGSVGIDGDSPTADLIGLGPQDSSPYFGSTVSFGTTTTQKIATKIAVVGGPLRKIDVRGASVNGTVTDNVTCDVYTDSAGLPGTSLGQVTLTGSTFGSNHTFDFSSAGITLTGGTSYWFVFSRSGSMNNTNNYNIGVQGSSLNASVYNGTSWSSASTGGYAFDVYYSNSVILRWGNYYADAVAAETYFRNFKVGSTLHGTDIWDGTAITSLGDFDANAGSASVVSDPTVGTHAYTDADTVGSKTTPSFSETPNVEQATPSTITSLIGSYLMETFTIHAKDYNWASWSTAYSFDGSIPTYGNVGMFDDDHGHIPGT